MPFSNLNRDDLGSPKALTFGGVQRTRISSQCWKRATRSDMEAALTGAPGYDRAVRTRKPVDILANELVAKGWDAKDATHAARVTFGPFLAAEKAKNDEDDEPSTGGSNVLLFLTMSQYADLAVLADQNKDVYLKADPAKKAKTFAPLRKAIEAKILNPRGLITVFGRMIAELPAANVDSAVQVAHAFTTHENASEIDYFTAVDDFTHEDATGAGHLGTAEFTAGTFYRNATIDLADLAKNTGDPAIAADLAAQFLLSFAQSLPTGKSTSTAPNTRPDLVVIQVRDDAPLSWSTAFEAPVRQRGNGYLAPSVQRLAEHATLVADAYGDTPIWAGHLSTVPNDSTGPFGERVTGGLAALVQAAIAAANGTTDQQGTAA